MTTAVKPLPPHGSYARANGCPGYRAPCKCDTCVTALRRFRKRSKVNRQLGRPGLVDATPARQHLAKLARTMTWGQIATATGGEPRNLHLIADGRRTQIRRSTLTAIVAVKAETPAPGKYIDATGIRRRIQALRAIGWSSNVIAKAASTAEARIQTIATEAQPTVRYVLAAKILKVYAELSQTPAPTGRSGTRTRNHAAANGWAPPGAWDDDRIDDPAAFPDWTGHCGSDRGWWLHRLEDIPTCQPCEQAHAEWKAERTHLSRDQRWSEIGKARATARSREADLAHDARELMRVCGLDTEQAAERLGVTRNHLQQAMGRHPEAVGEVAA